MPIFFESPPLAQIWADGKLTHWLQVTAYSVETWSRYFFFAGAFFLAAAPFPAVVCVLDGEFLDALDAGVRRRRFKQRGKR
jgi:hypothetical protein